VVNRYSGLAIEGYDPVAYFHRRARDGVGLPDYEAAQAGAVMAFSAMRATWLPSWLIPKSTARNLAVTTRSIWRGASPAGGNPRFWAVKGQRLYLFGREEHRDAFAADPGRFSE